MTNTGNTITVNDTSKHIQKYSDIQVKQRRDWILEMVLDHIPRKEIKKRWEERYPTLSNESLLNDFTKVYQQIRESLPTTEQLVVDHIGKYHQIYQNCMEIGDSKNAMQALKEIERLYQVADKRGIGESSVNKLVVKNTINVKTSDLSFEQIKQLLGKQDDTDNPLLINKAHNWKGVNAEESIPETPIQDVQDITPEEHSSERSSQPITAPINNDQPKPDLEADLPF
jgi:hypothetical protein